MGSYNSTVITTVGQALLASAIANQKDVVFSKFQVSDHVYPAGTDLSALTSLQSVQKETAPSGASVYDSTTIHTSATVDNSGVLTEFNANTLGLFITVDSTEVLFGVSTAITPDVFPKDVGGVPSTYTYSMNLVVSSTENVTISVDMDAYLTAADVVDNLNTSSSTSPLSAGMGKQLGESLANAIDNEGDAYSDSSTYEVGNYCIYQDRLYKCNTDISVAEAWDPTHWDATTIGYEIGRISSDLSELFVVEDIKNNLTPTNCTIRYAYAKVVGNACLLNMVLDITGSIIANTVIVSGLPGQTLYSPIEGMHNATGHHIPMHIGSASGTLVMSPSSPISTLGAGDVIIINGVYFVEP